jgi:mannose-6-phosphate isomerase-like protein (cupin superfamily)
MHCVAEYPTADEHLQLNQIDLLKQRYQHIQVGFSTHESPDNVDSIKMAVAKGATVFEKHVGVPTERFPLNAYSANPEQVRRWLTAASEAIATCGVTGKRSQFSAAEIASLRSLARGVFARRDLAQCERIMPGDVFPAIPSVENQILADGMSKYLELTATADIPACAPLLSSNTSVGDVRQKLLAIVDRVKDLLRTSSAVIPSKADLEVSHHYGIDRFDEFGLTMLTVVNRGYCKKLLVLLPGQQNPEHRHNVKEESFHVLHGDVWVELDGKVTCYGKGDVILVEHGVKHRFGSKTGAVLEEVSLTHHAEDSFYSDPAIRNNRCRKSFVTHWLD